MVRRIVRLVPALALLTAGALMLGACRGRWHASPEEKAEKITRRIAGELDLSESQRARLDGIKDDILARKADFAALKSGFRDLAVGQLRAGTLDTGEVTRDLEAREAKAKELRAFMVAKLAEFHAVLEPAQREKLAARIEEHARDCR